MGVAVGHLKLSLNEFWGMTPSELDLLTGEALDRHAREHGQLTRDEKDELLRIGREAMEREVKNGRD